MLQVFDPGNRVKKRLEIFAKGSRGTTRMLHPEDNGKEGDVIAGDHIFSVPVPSFPDPKIRLEIEAGKARWDVSISLDPNDEQALIILRLGLGGKVTQLTQNQMMRYMAPRTRVQPPPMGHRSPRTKNKMTQYQAHTVKVPPFPLGHQTPPTAKIKTVMTPGKPIEPGKPAIRVTPGKPVEPGKPSISVTPGAPVEPGKPAISVTPVTPGAPAKPSIYMAPVQPGAPAKPSISVTPGAPVEPAKPSISVTPVEPGKPGKPAISVTPGEPVEPVTPGKPVEPGEPGKPVASGAPGKPSNSVEPGEPVEPVTPGKPVEPVTPGEPVEPGKPGKPVEPEKPSISVEPGKPVEPGEPKTYASHTPPRNSVHEVQNETTPGAADPIGILNLGFVFWALGFVASGLGVGVALTLGLRRRRPVARLSTGVQEDTLPQTLSTSTLQQALTGPLKQYRVVVLGATPIHLPNLTYCDECPLLPDELLAAAERLALAAGPPVALLITEPDCLEQAGTADPVVRLARQLRGRCSLWVVGGPEDWPTWEPPRR